MGVFFRVLKPYPFLDARGHPLRPMPHPGDLVTIRTRQEVKSFLAAGVIGPSEQSIKAVAVTGQSAQDMAQTRRIGIWLVTSKEYSGGRIHMYQFAWTLASLGAEVYLITNRMPQWAEDYPQIDNLHVYIENRDKVPPDLDVIVTDSKGDLGRRALSYRNGHPDIPFVCFNFETPNWPANFDPECANPDPEALKHVHDYGKRLGANLLPTVFQQAQLLIANSRESLKYMEQWVGQEVRSSILPPAVNTFALDLAAKHPASLKNLPKRPYAVYSARSALYKGGDVAIEAVWKLDTPMDLVVFGTLNRPPQPCALHKIHGFLGRSDLEKYTMMRNAAMILAPSLFEGYGMVPGEGLCSGKPVITYDLPVLRQEYGDRLIYACWGDRKDFCAKVAEVAANPEAFALSDTQVQENKAIFGMVAMRERLEGIPYFAMKRRRISAQLICYWGFVPESIESIYPYVDEIIVAHGPTAIAKDLISSDDLAAQEGAASLKLLQDFPDPDNKIVIEAKDWRNKRDMRNWCAARATGNHMLILDGDEIWVGMQQWLDANVPFSSPRWLNFWHDENHWICDSGRGGRRWGKSLDPCGSTCPHYRWSWWRPSYSFLKHPLAYDSSKRCIFNRDTLAAESCQDAIIYHLGHALTKPLMEIKHEFYAVRDGRDAGRKQRRDAWHEWNGQVGECGDGMITKVDWKLPEIVTRAFDGMRERGGTK